MISTIFFLLLNCFTGPAPDTISKEQLQQFWADCITPIIEQDRERLDQIIHFPLEGDWGFLMELDKAPENWTREDFFEHLDLLFTKEFLEDLQSQNFTDAEVWDTETDRAPEILVSHSSETEDGFESSIILRFRQVSGVWKLVIIQAVG